MIFLIMEKKKDIKKTIDFLIITFLEEKEKIQATIIG